MRIVSSSFDSEVSGTTTGDALEVNAWRLGVPTPSLNITEWRINWDADRQVQGQASFTVADPDGRLAPWSMGDPLAPGGSRLQVTWISGLSGTRVPLGWWRIRKANPHEAWRVVTLTTQTTITNQWVPGGGSVELEADEETATAVLNRMDAEVVLNPTVLTEVNRLLFDVCPMRSVGVTDGPVPANMVYSDARMDAIDDLLDTLNATYRMGPDGVMEVVPRAGVGPVWTVAGGDAGVLVELVRALSDDGIANAVTSTNETAAGLPLVGRAYLGTGPLAWGGPFGKVPLFHKAIATTPEGVLSDATTLLASRQTTGEVDLAVTCVAHPGIQLHDRVTLLAPTRAGDTLIIGRVVAMSLSSSDGAAPAKVMSLTVRVGANDLESIAAKVRLNV